MGLKAPDLNKGRQFGKGCFKEFDGSSSGMSIARAKFSVPEILGYPIEAEKGMIGGAAPLLGVVADASHLLFAILRIRTVESRSKIMLVGGLGFRTIRGSKRS